MHKLDLANVSLQIQNEQMSFIAFEVVLAGTIGRKDVAVVQQILGKVIFIHVCVGGQSI